MTNRFHCFVGAPLEQVAPVRILHDHLLRYDALIVDVVSVTQQTVLCRPCEVYSCRFNGHYDYKAPTLEFVGSAGSWGNRTLQPGERTLVFVGCVHSGRLYQRHMQGHLTLEDIDGQLCAIAHWDLLASGKPWEPKYLFEAAFRPNEGRKRDVAMPFNLLERYIQEELHRIGSS